MELKIFRTRRASKSIGEVPGTLHLDPEAPPPVVRVMAYGPENCQEQEITDVASLRGLLHKSPVTWVNVDGLGDAETITAIGETFALHPLALEDVGQRSSAAEGRAIRRGPLHRDADGLAE